MYERIEEDDGGFDLDTHNPETETPNIKHSPLNYHPVWALGDNEKGCSGFDTRTSREVTHPSTILAHWRLSAEFGWDPE